MMKRSESLKLERDAEAVLQDLLPRIPALRIGQVHREYPVGDALIDIAIDASIGKNKLSFWIELKTNGQPRIVRDAAVQLKRLIGEERHIVPIVMSTYLSEQARDVCKEEGVCYLDLFGNTLLKFETIYIERQVAARPEAERRSLRTLFKPKSARILRTLLRNPDERWRVVDLAAAAEVSLGLVSTIGSALRERGWATHTGEGLTLVDPNGLLDAWAADYEPPPGELLRFYTHLHGRAFTDRWEALHMERGKVALSSFSAAQWLAPFVRNSTTYLYVDADGLDAARSVFQLSSGSKGANVVVGVLEDDGALDDAILVGEGLMATSPVQTYLDLMHAGERGQEGAEHLRETLLEWPNGR